MIVNKRWLIALISMMVLLTACGPSAKFTGKNVPKPREIAVLTTINNTTDVDGGIVFRNLIYQLMPHYKSGYRLQNRDVTDSLLADAGITDGGQLDALSRKELSEILGVDGLMYVTVNALEYKTLGISSTRKVSANLKLYSGDQLYWEDEREVDNGKSGFNTLLTAINDPKQALKESAEDLAWQVAEKGVKGWLLKHPLKPEMMDVLDNSLQTLP